MNCRHCRAPLEELFLDLGLAPPSNAYLRAEDLGKPERVYPLRLRVCTRCWLVQTEDYAGASELFNADYAYFSSVTPSWVEHAARYARAMIGKLKLGRGSFVIEVASNDGYLLTNFVAAGIPCLGIEPTASTASQAEARGVPTLREFFGVDVARRLQREGRQADLIVGNNVYAHVPDINGFTQALKLALKPGGTVTLEFPHLVRLIEQGQFDTVYHEHFSYLSLFTARHVFADAGLRVFDVEELATHGGSLRLHGCHAEDARAETPAVARVLAQEERAGLRDVATYRSFQARADRVRDELLRFLAAEQRAGRSVAAYGAAAKGNTLLNYAGVKPDLVPYVCDAAPSKQGKFMPGSRIPIVPPEVLRQRKPDTVLILPWNLADEIMAQQAMVRDWGGRFAVGIPTLRILD